MYLWASSVEVGTQWHYRPRLDRPLPLRVVLFVAVSPAPASLAPNARCAKISGRAAYRGVPLERVIENTHFTAFPYQFGLFNETPLYT